MTFSHQRQMQIANEKVHSQNTSRIPNGSGHTLKRVPRNGGEMGIGVVVTLVQDKKT